jgi:hypothetical protein
MVTLNRLSAIQPGISARILRQHTQPRRPRSSPLRPERARACPVSDAAGLKSKGENGEQGRQSDEVAGIGYHEQCPQDGISDETLERRLSHLGPKVYRRQGHKKNQTKRDPRAGNSKLIQKATFSHATKRLRGFRRPRGFPSKSELSNPPQSRPSMAELGLVITDRVSGPGTGSE